MPDHTTNTYRSLQDFSPTLPERFWDKIDRNGPVIRPELGPCWKWTGGKIPCGYGSINVYWDAERKRSVALNAHIVSWLIHYGPLEMDTCVLHKCENRNGDEQLDNGEGF